MIASFPVLLAFYGDIGLHYMYYIDCTLSHFHKYLEQLLCSNFTFYSVSAHLCSPHITILFACCVSPIPHSISFCASLLLPFHVSSLLLTSAPFPRFVSKCQLEHTNMSYMLHMCKEEGVLTHSHAAIKGCDDIATVPKRVQEVLFFSIYLFLCCISHYMCRDRLQIALQVMK